MTWRSSIFFATAVVVSLAGLARASTDAQGRPRVEAVVSAEAVVLGDAFALLVEIEHDAGMPVEVPAPLELGDAFAERARAVRSERRGERTTTTVRLELIALAVGDVEVPPLPVRYTSAAGPAEVETSPVSLRVAGVVGDSDALRPIAPPVAVSYRDWTVVHAAVAAVAGLVLLALARRIARAFGRRRKSVAATRAKAARHRPPAADEALARLAELEASGALDAADRKPAFVRLSEIMRDYAGRRFDFPGLELSTDEIRRALRRRDADEVAERLGPWLAAGDMVKFAGYDASADEARTALYDARRMVQEWGAGAAGAGAGEAGRDG